MPKRWLIRYPFPLADGSMAWLDLPASGLDQEEADRLQVFISALVQGPQRGPREDA